MGEIHQLPLYRVIRTKLGEFDAFATDGLDGVLTIFVSEELDDDKAAVEARRVWSDWRHRLSSLSGAAIAWLCHAAHVAGKHTGPTLAGAGVAGLAAGAMLTLVVTDAAPPPQASRPAVMRPQTQPDADADPLAEPVKAPLSLTPGDSPAVSGGRSGSSVQPGAAGPVASALATAGVPTPGHPLKPARMMVVTSVKSALPSAVPVPSHPVRCAAQVVLSHGKPVEVRKCV